MSLKKLYQAGFLRPKGGFYFLKALATEGTNLMALLQFAKNMAPKKLAVVDADGAYTYKQLYDESKSLAQQLSQHKTWQSGEKIAIAAHNSYAFIKLIFAASKLGMHLYLLNAEMTQQQLDRLHKKLKFDYLVIDQELVLQLHEQTVSVKSLSSLPVASLQKLRKRKSGLLTVLTSGTSGNYKTAARKTASTTPFIAPFLALLRKANLNHYQNIFVATPIYHGFGLAAVIMSVALRASIHLQRKFQLDEASELIAKHNIEVLTTVPLIYDRLLKSGAEQLSSLKVVLCGGAPLRQHLVQASQKALGPILYNLYGTSEAGFCIMATPEDLQQNPSTIGKAIQGVRLRLLNDKGTTVKEGDVGHICIKSAWSVGEEWVDTGDLAYLQNELLIISGRSDDMIVSGGENVYPIELEEILSTHPLVQEVVVLGIKDEEFGQRLIAFVKAAEKLEQQDLLEWMKTKVARYQMPKEIIFIDQIPYNSLGKVDRKALNKTLKL